MANNFSNKIARNISGDLTAPTSLYSVPASKKSIVIELDVGNSSTAAQTISVLIDDYSAKGSNVACTAAAIASNTLVTGSAHYFIVNDRVQLTNAGTSTILNSGVAMSETAVFFVESIPSATSFTLSATPGGTALTLTGTHAVADIFNELYYSYIVRDAPIPIGGALKVVSGQKLVLEAQDSIIITASTANSVDAIASILEDVS